MVKRAATWCTALIIGNMHIDASAKSLKWRP
jgi:hypothetical protein